MEMNIRAYTASKYLNSVTNVMLGGDGADKFRMTRFMISQITRALTKWGQSQQTRPTKQWMRKRIEAERNLQKENCRCLHSLCAPHRHPAAELCKPSAEPDLSPWAASSQGKSIRNQHLFLPFSLSWSESNTLSNRQDRANWLCKDEFFKLMSQWRLAKYSGIVATTFYFMYIPDVLHYTPSYKDSCTIPLLVSDFVPDF